VNYTKINYEKVSYSKLAQGIKDQITFERFFDAYFADNSYVLGIVNESKDATIEVEYDSTKNRFLIREERESKVPSDQEIIFEQYGVKISVQYYLEEKRDILIEAYQIYSLDTDEKLSDSEQNYFSMKRSFEDKAKEAYNEQERQKAYLTYNDTQKASYWSRIFYRWMRWEGENGTSEDEVEFFQPEVMAKYREEEPNIDRLMPIILKQLARSWMFDEEEFFEKVNRQLGTSYSR